MIAICPHWTFGSLSWLVGGELKDEIRTRGGRIGFFIAYLEICSSTRHISLKKPYTLGEKMRFYLTLLNIMREITIAPCRSVFIAAWLTILKYRSVVCFIVISRADDIYISI